MAEQFAEIWLAAQRASGEVQAERYAEALVTAAEATARVRGLRDDPAMPSLLRFALNATADALLGLNRSAEARAVIDEQLGIGRAFAANGPGDAWLITALHNRARALAGFGRHADAAAAVFELVVTARKLAVDDPETYGLALAMGLSNLAGRYIDAGLSERATAPAMEAVELMATWVRTDPATVIADTGPALASLGPILRSADQRDGALAALAAAAEALCPLAVEETEIYLITST